MPASLVGSSPTSSDIAPPHSLGLSTQEIRRSLAFNPLFCMVAAFTGCCFCDVSCLWTVATHYTYFLPMMYVNTQCHTDGVIYLKPAHICIIFIYIYIKAQGLVKAIDADHFMLQPHGSCVHSP